MKIANDTKQLFEKLQNGATFYDKNYYSHEVIDGKEIGYFSPVLYVTYRNNILWRNFGQSANPNKISELVWILKTIFKQTATEFMAQYAEVY